MVWIDSRRYFSYEVVKMMCTNEWALCILYNWSMQFLLVLPLLNHFIQLCILVPFLSINSYISINYRCYDFWLAMKRLLVDDETTSHMCRNNLFLVMNCCGNKTTRNQSDFWLSLSWYSLYDCRSCCLILSSHFEVKNTFE